jgi:hypothetical protein
MRLTQKHYVYAGLFTLTVVSVFILIIGYIAWSPINRQAVARIERGMTEAQVAAILGGPCTMEMAIPADVATHKTFGGARSIKTWRDERATCRVLFDGAGLVVGASFHEIPDTGLIGRIRRMLSR